MACGGPFRPCEAPIPRASQMPRVSLLELARAAPGSHCPPWTWGTLQRPVGASYRPCWETEGNRAKADSLNFARLSTSASDEREEEALVLTTATFPGWLPPCTCRIQRQAL
jgi:hypothetical protein